MQPREIACTVDGPVPIHDSPHLASGCLVQDVTLASPRSLHEIRFRNFYVHSLSLWVQRAEGEDLPPTSASGTGTTASGARPDKLGPWELSVKDRILMPRPLCDAGSQDYITVSRKQSLTDWCGVTRLRFVLRQPVPHWRQFRLEQVRLLAPPSHVPPQGGTEEGEQRDGEWRKLLENTRAAVQAENGVQVFSGPDGEIAYIGGSYDVQSLQLPEG